MIVYRCCRCRAAPQTRNTWRIREIPKTRLSIIVIGAHRTRLWRGGVAPAVVASRARSGRALVASVRRGCVRAKRAVVALVAEPGRRGRIGHGTVAASRALRTLGLIIKSWCRAVSACWARLPDKSGTLRTVVARWAELWLHSRHAVVAERKKGNSGTIKKVENSCVFLYVDLHYWPQNKIKSIMDKKNKKAVIKHCFQLGNDTIFIIHYKNTLLTQVSLSKNILSTFSKTCLSVSYKNHYINFDSLSLSLKHFVNFSNMVNVRVVIEVIIRIDLCVTHPGVQFQHAAAPVSFMYVPWAQGTGTAVASGQ